MHTAPTISTERLTLRPHQMADFPPLYALFASTRARFMGGPFDAKTMWYWIASEVGSWPLLGFGSWGVERQSDKTFLGQLGINKPHHFPEAEIGWVFLAEHEGQGYASEAAKAALRWWWSQHPNETLVSYIDPENTRSIALATRLGATHDPNAPLPAGETENETHVYRHSNPAQP